jgi:hypothetical protein
LQLVWGLQFGLGQKNIQPTFLCHLPFFGTLSPLLQLRSAITFAPNARWGRYMQIWRALESSVTTCHLRSTNQYPRFPPQSPQTYLSFFEDRELSGCHFPVSFSIGEGEEQDSTHWLSVCIPTCRSSGSQQPGTANQQQFGDAGARSAGTEVLWAEWSDATEEIQDSHPMPYITQHGKTSVCEDVSGGTTMPNTGPLGVTKP